MARLRSLTPRVWSRCAPRARVDGARYDIISLGPVGLAAGVTHRFRRAERWWVTAAPNPPYELKPRGVLRGRKCGRLKLMNLRQTQGDFAF
jgi:hypothetical protein